MGIQCFVPPPPPDPSSLVATALNSQFASGHASSNLSHAGVVIKVNDDCNDARRPWIMSEQPPCRDRIAVSVVRYGWPNIYPGWIPGVPWYRTRAPGMVFSEDVQSRISCSYPIDSGSAKQWRSCSPRG